MSICENFFVEGFNMCSVIVKVYRRWIFHERMVVWLFFLSTVIWNQLSQARSFDLHSRKGQFPNLSHVILHCIPILNTSVLPVLEIYVNSHEEWVGLSCTEWARGIKKIKLCQNAEMKNKYLHRGYGGKLVLERSEHQIQLSAKCWNNCRKVCILVWESYFVP